MAQSSPLPEVESPRAQATASAPWETRVAAIALSHVTAIKSRAAACTHGLAITHVKAIGPELDAADAVLIGFDGSAAAERQLEHLARRPSLALVAVASPREEIVHQALRCGADEAIAPSADLETLALALRRALARRSARSFAGVPGHFPSPPLTLVQETAEGLVILDHDGAVKFANEVAEALLGAEHGSLTGKPFRFPVSAGEPILTEFPEGRSTELRFIETEWGGVPARIGSLADVTVRRELERAAQALEELQIRMGARDREFVSELSATIRRPLTNIVGFSELMLAQVFGPVGDARYCDYLRDIRDSGLSVVGVVEALEQAHAMAVSQDLACRGVANSAPTTKAQGAQRFHQSTSSRS